MRNKLAVSRVMVRKIASALFAGHINELRQYSKSWPELMALTFPIVLWVIGVNVFVPRNGPG